jgi:hypothetical protein
MSSDVFPSFFSDQNSVCRPHISHARPTYVTLTRGTFSKALCVAFNEQFILRRKHIKAVMDLAKSFESKCSRIGAFSFGEKWDLSYVGVIVPLITRALNCSWRFWIADCKYRIYTKRSVNFQNLQCYSSDFLIPSCTYDYLQRLPAVIVFIIS